MWVEVFIIRVVAWGSLGMVPIVFGAAETMLWVTVLILMLLFPSYSARCKSSSRRPLST